MKASNNTTTLMLTTLVAGALSLGAAGAVAKDNPGAKSVDQLTAGWWQWQEANYPAYDFGGDYPDCSFGQKGEIWYLGGTGAGADAVTRECMDPIPAGKRLFFPLVNLSFYNSPGENYSVEEKREILDVYLSDIADPTEACKLSASVDGEPVIFSGTAIQRVQSPPFTYQGDPEAVSDGFWVLLPHLSGGEHTIQFTGSLCNFETGVPFEFVPGVTLEVDVTYEVNVGK